MNQGHSHPSGPSCSRSSQTSEAEQVDLNELQDAKPLPRAWPLAVIQQMKNSALWVHRGLPIAPRGASNPASQTWHSPAMLFCATLECHPDSMSNRLPQDPQTINHLQTLSGRQKSRVQTCFTSLIFPTTRRGSPCPGPAGGACSGDPSFTGSCGGATGNCWNRKTSGHWEEKTLQRSSFPSWKGNGERTAVCCRGEWW